MNLFAYLLSKEKTEGKTITGEGTSITLDGTSESKLDLTLSPSELSQASDPSPSSPQTVHTISGNNTITITNSDGTQIQTLPLNLGTNEYCKIDNYSDEFYKTSGKNMFNKNTVINNYRLNSEGNLYADNGYFASDYIEVKSNTNYSTNIIPAATKRMCEYDSNKTFINGKDNANVSTITTSANTKYIRIVGLTTELDNCMLNEGGEVLPFEPFGENEWWLKKNTDKITINGTPASITVRTNTVLCYINRIVNSNIIRGDNYNKLYSSHFEGKNLSNDVIGVMTGYNSTYNFGFVIVGLPLEAGSTSESISDYLSSINANLYYPLAYSIYVPLNITLQEQIEAIYNNALSHESETNINQTNADLPFIISASSTTIGSLKINKSKYLLLDPKED